MGTSSPRPKRAASRYGTAPQQSSNWSGKLLAIAAVVFVVFAVITVAGFLQRKEAQLFDPTISGFSRVSDTVMHLDVDVTRKKPTEAGVCIVYALDYFKAEIGRREFLMPGNGETRFHASVDIPTRGVPVVGRVYGCSDKVPAYLTKEPTGAES